MHISKFNRKITFLVVGVTFDEIGNRKNTWSPFYSCYAYVHDEGGSEKESAGQIVGSWDVVFTVRDCSMLKGIKPDTARIFFHDEFYNIIHIDHMNYQGKLIKLKCRKERYV